MHRRTDRGISGCRVGDIDTTQWIWTVRRQTTPAPGGLTDKGTKGKRARKVPIVGGIRPLVAQRTLSVGPNPDARLFTGPAAGPSPPPSCATPQTGMT